MKKLIYLVVGVGLINMIDGLYQSFQGADHVTSGSYYVIGYVHLNIALTLFLINKINVLNKSTKM